MQVRKYGDQIVYLSKTNLHTKFGVVRSLSTSITSLASTSTSTSTSSWPFVTVPDFRQRANELMDLSGSDAVAFVPIVPRDVLGEWKEYADGVFLYGINNGGDNDGVRQLDLNAFHGQDSVPKPMPYAPIHQLATSTPSSSCNGIRHDCVVAIDDGPQSEPTDLFTFPSFRHSSKIVNSTRTATIWAVPDLGLAREQEEEEEESSNADQPHSYVLQPIFKNFEEGSSVAGYVLVSIPWRNYFYNLLPPGVRGMVVEVSNSCGVARHRYVMNGPDEVLPVPASDDDSSDSDKYESLRIRYEFGDIEGAEDQGDQPPLSFSTCRYALDVYPSNEFRAAYYSTNYPAVYASVSVVTFVAVACYLICYNNVKDGTFCGGAGTDAAAAAANEDDAVAAKNGGADNRSASEEAPTTRSPSMCLSLSSSSSSSSSAMRMAPGFPSASSLMTTTAPSPSSS